jgi:hypothetical protein
VVAEESFGCCLPVLKIFPSRILVWGLARLCGHKNLRGMSLHGPLTIHKTSNNKSIPFYTAAQHFRFKLNVRPAVWSFLSDHLKKDIITIIRPWAGKLEITNCCLGLLGFLSDVLNIPNKHFK